MQLCVSNAVPTVLAYLCGFACSCGVLRTHFCQILNATARIKRGGNSPCVLLRLRMFVRCAPNTLLTDVECTREYQTRCQQSLRTYAVAHLRVVHFGICRMQDWVSKGNASIHCVLVRSGMLAGHISHAHLASHQILAYVCGTEM